MKLDLLCASRRSYDDLGLLPYSIEAEIYYSKPTVYIVIIMCSSLHYPTNEARRLLPYLYSPLLVFFVTSLLIAVVGHEDPALLTAASEDKDDSGLITLCDFCWPYFLRFLSSSELKINS